MEWFLGWGLKITGIIIIAAVLDIIMIEGNVKKYIKPGLGVLLVLVIIKPILGESKNLTKTDFILTHSESFNRLTLDFEKTNQSNILKLYEERLAGSIKECIKKWYHTDSSVTVETTKESLTGDIKRVEIEVKSKDGTYMNTEEVKRCIAEEFGIEKANIEVFLLEAG